jgi:2'-5' RNA ligase
MVNFLVSRDFLALLSSLIFICFGSVMKSKRQLTHFIGLKLKHESFYERMRNIQNELVSRNNQIEKLLITPSKFHFTLLIMDLSDEEKLRRAQDCFQQAEVELFNLLNQSQVNSVTFSKLNAFGGNKPRVIYAEPKEDDAHHFIECFTTILNQMFLNADIDAEKNDILHCTIAKITRKHHKVKMFRGDYEDMDHHFNNLTCPLTDIELLKIDTIDPTTQYYQSVATIRIN